MSDIFYHAVPADWRREEKYRFLEDKESIANVEWQKLQPDKHHNWLTEGMSDEFESLLPVGSKEGGEQIIFKLASNGAKTNRDVWMWNFSRDELTANAKRMIETYNDHVLRWPHRADKSQKPDDFVTYDETKIGWSRDLKKDMERGRLAEFSGAKLRPALIRPFTREWLFFDRVMDEEIYSLESLFPTAATENRAICVSDIGHRSPFGALLVDRIPEMHVLASSDGFKCFPFFTYAADGSGRRENVTDWALAQFRARYQSAIVNPQSEITKWDIFHYVYAVLHHPEYRARYAANLRRELPRIPFVAAEVTGLTSKSETKPANEDGASSRRLLQDAEVFHAFAAAGKRLAELHVGYEQQPEYPLNRRENPKAPLNWRVEKMKLVGPASRRSPSSSRPQKPETAATAVLRYNDFLTLEGIPPEAFQYRLGNRSALEWVIGQYQLSTDPRSGITNDPNRPDDPEYIVRLLGQVITVSLETTKVVKGLPALGM